MIYVQYSGSKYGSDFTEFPIWIRIQEKVSDPDPATTLHKELQIWIRMKDKVLDPDPTCSGSDPFFFKAYLETVSNAFKRNNPLNCYIPLTHATH